MTATYANSHRTHTYWTKNDLKILNYFNVLKRTLKREINQIGTDNFLKLVEKYPKGKEI